MRLGGYGGTASEHRNWEGQQRSWAGSTAKESGFSENWAAQQRNWAPKELGSTTQGWDRAAHHSARAHRHGSRQQQWGGISGEAALRLLGSARGGCFREAGRCLCGCEGVEQLRGCVRLEAPDAFSPAAILPASTRGVGGVVTLITSHFTDAGALLCGTGRVQRGDHSPAEPRGPCGVAVRRSVRVSVQT